MTADQLRTMLRAQPFRPFDLHLADRRCLPVEHPVVVAITPPGRTIGIALAEDTIEIVDLMLLTGLKPRPPAASRRRKKRGQ